MFTELNGKKYLKNFYLLIGNNGKNSTNNLISTHKDR